MNIDLGETHEEQNAENNPKTLSKLEFPHFNEILNVKLQ